MVSEQNNFVEILLDTHIISNLIINVLNPDSRQIIIKLLKTVSECKTPFDRNKEQIVEEVRRLTIIRDKISDNEIKSLLNSLIKP